MLAFSSLTMKPNPTLYGIAASPINISVLYHNIISLIHIQTPNEKLFLGKKKTKIEMFEIFCPREKSSLILLLKQLIRC